MMPRFRSSLSLILKTFSVCGALYLSVSPAGAIDADKLSLALPGPPRLPAIGSSRIQAMVAKNKKYPTVKGYRDLAEAYLALNRPADAAAMFRAEAALHRRRGFNEAAMKQELRAARYDTDIKLFLDRPLTQAEFDASYTKAAFEPAVGAFVGAYIDYDEALPTRLGISSLSRASCCNIVTAL